MRRSNIAFANLRVEMERRGIRLQDIAQACGFNRDTLARKLSKKSAINLSDAFQIQKTMFPDLDVIYLFDGPVPEMAQGEDDATQKENR